MRPCKKDTDMDNISTLSINGYVVDFCQDTGRYRASPERLIDAGEEHLPILFPDVKSVEAVLETQVLPSMEKDGHDDGARLLALALDGDPSVFTIVRQDASGAHHPTQIAFARNKAAWMLDILTVSAALREQMKEADRIIGLHRRRKIKLADAMLHVAEITGDAEGISIACVHPNTDRIIVKRVPRRSLRPSFKQLLNQNLLVSAPNLEITQQTDNIATVQLRIDDLVCRQVILISEFQAEIAHALGGDYPGDIDPESGWPFVEFDAKDGCLIVSLRTTDEATGAITGRSTTTFSKEETDRISTQARTALTEIDPEKRPRREVLIAFGDFRIIRLDRLEYIEAVTSGLRNRIDFQEFVDAVITTEIQSGK